MSDYNLKKVLCQLNQWCATNNISVQSVYDECHGMTLQELVHYLLGVVKEAVNQVVENTDNYQELYQFVHDYFNNLNVQQEVDNKLDEMYADGSLNSLINTDVYNRLEGKIANKNDYLPLINTYNKFSYETVNTIIKKFLNKWNTDPYNTKIFFAGDSWCAGQGATNNPDITYVRNFVSGPLDGFHMSDDELTNKYVDLIGNAMNIIYGMQYVDSRIRVDNQTLVERNGNWQYNNIQNLLFTYSNTPNDNLILNQEYGKQNYFHFFTYITDNSGKFSIKAKPYDDIYSEFKNLTEIDAICNFDGNIIDAYDSSNPMTLKEIYIVFPYGKRWQLKITVESSETGLGNVFISNYDLKQNMFNCGRGNHTTADFLGINVPFGASNEDGDHTNHLQAILDENPDLIILEPMIINDWFHGLSQKNSYNCIQNMLQMIKNKGCDCIVLTPSVVITDKNSYNYNTVNTEAQEKPPLTDNIHNAGTYGEYYQNMLNACLNYDFPVISTAPYFNHDFFVNNNDWTVGTNAGRIHVNDYGHRLLYNCFTQNSTLFVNDATLFNGVNYTIPPTR